MSYWKNVSKNTRILDNFVLATNQSGGGSSVHGEFYELEMGIVLDIVMDENHPIFKTSEAIHSEIDTDRWPEDLKGNPPAEGDLDYTWIGRALVRAVESQTSTNKDQLLWAKPLENNLSEYPLINELVVLVKYNGELYYSRKLNYHNWPHNNLDFSINKDLSGKDNTELFSDSLYTGRMESKTSWAGTKSFKGYAGKYYYANNKIRTLKRFEGDLNIESRHGQNILFKAYDKTRVNDAGDPNNSDYKDGGNPMIIIRNRQRKLLSESETLELYDSPNPATVTGTKQEKNVGGYLEENINHDGSSIYITSGVTISEWVTTCYKRMFGDQKGEEVFAFKGKSSFIYPKLNGDQIVIQSDRLIFSSRYKETFHYSKKRYSIVTDSEYTVDSQDQMVFTTHVKTVFNSPVIYLGEYDKTDEPVLLGQTTINWLHDLCDWLLEHTHWYHHSHIDAGKESPEQTQIPVQLQKLITMRDALHCLASRRVFITGGGFAPGQNGASISGGARPTKILIDNKY